MAVLQFCDKCFNELRDQSPDLLRIWTLSGMLIVKLRRPITIDEFEDIVYESTGMRRHQIKKTLKNLESMGYLVTHEIDNLILMIPLGIKKEDTDWFSICSQNHSL